MLLCVLLWVCLNIYIYIIFFFIALYEKVSSQGDIEILTAWSVHFVSKVTSAYSFH